MKRALLFASLALATLSMWAGERKPDSADAAPTTAAVVSPSRESDQLEGERRYRTNCGRCHQPPHKYPPRMMATMVRHMRVRATITDEDMRYILAYMTR
jgi:cytochrome c553